MLEGGCRPVTGAKAGQLAGEGRKEEAGPKGGREAGHHGRGPRPESVWLPRETRHEVMAKMNLNLVGGGGWEPQH